MPDGLSYKYCDSNSCNTLKNSNDLSENSSPLMATMAQLNQSGVKSKFWNDEVPNGKTDLTHGHIKGFLGIDQSEGFVIDHSAPKFPTVNANGKVDLSYPKSAETYGQHFFCVTVASKTITKLDNFLDTTETVVYYPQTSLIRQFFNKFQKSASNNKISFQSAGGESFIAFAKSPSEPINLYDDRVAPGLGVSLRIETWGNGAGGLLQPTCSKIST